MAMSKPQPVSVMLVASTSAALHAGAAVLFVPTLSFLMLCWNGTPVQNPEAAQTETAMVFAVLSPLMALIFGFAAGASMALAHNVFAHGQRKVAIAQEETRTVQASALSNVA